MTDTAIPRVESAAVNLSEDWISAILGTSIFVLALLGLSGVDLLGWAATAKIWLVPATALAPVGKSYAALGGLPALILTYIALLVVLSGAAALLRANVGRFALTFSAVFWLALDRLDHRQLCAFRGGHPGRHRQDRRHLVPASDAGRRTDPRAHSPASSSGISSPVWLIG